MTDTIFLTGIVATPPREMRTNSGLTMCSFRLASSQRRYDRAKADWVDGDTNWYTVTAFRHLAENAAASIAKGDHIVVGGRLRVRAWENGDRSGIAVEVDAESLGHDLLWGRSQFSRIPPTRSSAPQPSPSPSPDIEGVSPAQSTDMQGASAQEPTAQPGSAFANGASTGGEAAVPPPSDGQRAPSGGPGEPPLEEEARWHVNAEAPF